MKLYLSRDKKSEHDENPNYDLWIKRPAKAFGTYESGDDLSRCEPLCADDFERFCPHLKLKPGQCIPIAILDLRKWEVDDE